MKRKETGISLILAALAALSGGLVTGARGGPALPDGDPPAESRRVYASRAAHIFRRPRPLSDQQDLCVHQRTGRLFLRPNWRPELPVRHYPAAKTLSNGCAAERGRRPPVRWT